MRHTMRPSSSLQYWNKQTAGLRIPGFEVPRREAEADCPFDSVLISCGSFRQVAEIRTDSTWNVV